MSDSLNQSLGNSLNDRMRRIHVIHLVGVVLCVREPRIFDLWLTRVGKCPRVRNHAIWRCNSYRP